MNLIDKITVKYLTDDEKIFFASLLVQISKIETREIPTAGVAVIDGQINLFYNPDFLTEIKEKYGINKLKGILEHELLHLVFDHIPRAKDFSREHQIYNIACDMAINQLIKDDLLPPKNELIYPEQYKLPPKENAEFYYKKLIQKAIKITICNECNGTGKDKKGNKCKKCNGEGGVGTGSF